MDVLSNSEILVLGLDHAERPLGSDRRAFMVRSALVASMVSLTGCEPTAKEMNSKYKETSEGGLAVSVVLC